MTKTTKSIICILIISLLVMGTLHPVAVESKKTDKYIDVKPGESLSLENDNVRLNVDTEFGEFSVTEKKSGNIWYSSPPLGDEYDENATGLTRTNMRSALVVTFCDDQKNVSECNTRTSSLFNNDMTVQKDGKSVRFVYKFEEGFTIPLTVELSENGVKAHVTLADIENKGKNKILKIEILPFFGAGAPNEKGYIVVPDGCGATVPFNGGTPVKTEYKKDVYGADSVMFKELDVVVEKNILMPMFGINKGTNAFIAVAAKGDADSKIAVDLNSSYSAAAFEFIYRNMDVTVLNAASVRSKEINVTSTGTASCDEFCVEYMLYSGKDLTYIDMADKYREYLSTTQDFGKTASVGNSLNLSYTATAKITKSFLGVPYGGELLLTTLDDLTEVNKTLKKYGIKDTVFNLNNAFSNGKDSKIVKKAKILSSVGNKKDYEELKKALKANGNNLFFVTDFQHVYKSGNGVSKNFSTVRGVSGAVCKITEYYPETYGPNDFEYYYLLNAKSMDKVVNKFVKSLKKVDYSIGISSMGSELYGDYSRRNNLDRQAMLSEKTDALNRLKKASGKLYFDGANSYAFGSAAFIGNVPTASSQYDFFGEDIPFVQCVLHGFVDYSSRAVNLAGNTADAQLRAIEYGAALKYDLICKDSYDLSSSSAKNLYSSDNQYWLPKIIEKDQAISGFYRSVAGKKIVKHEALAKKVMKTTYENGSYSIVNYTDNTVKAGGKEIAAHSFELFSEEDN